MPTTHMSFVAQTAIFAFVAMLVSLAACSTQSELPHRSAAYSLKAGSLFEAFDQHETESQHKYVGKVVEVQGTITAITQNPDASMTLELATQQTGAVYCNFYDDMRPDANHLKTGHIAKVRGICAGFVIDVHLEDCMVITH